MSESNRPALLKAETSTFSRGKSCLFRFKSEPGIGRPFLGALTFAVNPVNCIHHLDQRSAMVFKKIGAIFGVGLPVLNTLVIRRDLICPPQLSEKLKVIWTKKSRITSEKKL